MSKKLSMLLVLSVLLTGCASIVNGVNQPISITTTPTDGATCELKNSKGVWYVSSTPGSVVVHRSASALEIQCRKSGYATGYQRVKPNAKAMVAGNVFFGGAIGAGVDLANGAAFYYPSPITVPMQVEHATHHKK